MRQFKFRAWDKIYRRMIYFSDDWFIQDDEHEGLVFPGINNKYLSGYKEDFELMQWTGLKDKNGKEIYEGDIVKLLSSDDKYLIGEIIFEKCCFSLKINNKERHFLPFFDKEILGNVYENPELLKEDLK